MCGNKINTPRPSKVAIDLYEESKRGRGRGRFSFKKLDLCSPCAKGFMLAVEKLVDPKKHLTYN